MTEAQPHPAKVKLLRLFNENSRPTIREMGAALGMTEPDHIWISCMVHSTLEDEGYLSTKHGGLTTKGKKAIKS